MENSKNRITVIYGPPATGKTEYLRNKALKPRYIKVLPLTLDRWPEEVTKALDSKKDLLIDEFGGELKDWIILFGELLKAEKGEVYIVTNQSPPGFIDGLENTGIIKTRRGQNPIKVNQLPEN